MKSTIIAAVIVTLFSVPVFAADSTPQAKVGPNFEQHKAEIVKRIDARIARNQEEKACVQASTNHEAVKACRDKFKEEMKDHRHK